MTILGVYSCLEAEVGHTELSSMHSEPYQYVNALSAKKLKFMAPMLRPILLLTAACLSYTFCNSRAYL